MKNVSLWTILRKVHEDDEGVVSLETILVVALIALPILIFLYKFGWPKIKGYFVEGLDELEEGKETFADPDAVID